MNEEHYNILKKGVDEWNKWRSRNPKIFPNLMDANLTKERNLNRINFRKTNLTNVNLTNVSLHKADLSETKLSFANLTQAFLSHANLNHVIANNTNFEEANLIFANLSYSDFDNANLSDTYLGNADLSNTSLHGTNLTRADLSGTNLKDCSFRETLFIDINLKLVLNLDTSLHSGPSIIDHRTLLRSGTLPLEFLRGIGLPDVFINEYPNLFLDQVIQFYSCFLSYSSEDEEFAKRIHADLQNNGIRCWFAPEDLKIGDKIRTSIDQAIRVFDKLLLVFSAKSIISDWVEVEVEKAIEKERITKKTVLFPIRLDETVLDAQMGWAGHIKRTRHIGDFSNWEDHSSYIKAFERLLRDLKQE